VLELLERGTGQAGRRRREEGLHLLRRRGRGFCF